MTKILHVDNEKDTLDVVKLFLTEEGYEVVNATDGKECLKLMEREKFDLVILDVMMPGMSGWDVFQHIAKTYPGQKVVFLSVMEVSEERKKLLKQKGLVDYLIKPFEPQELVKRIKVIVPAKK